MPRSLIIAIILILFSCNNNDKPKLETPITKPVEKIFATRDQQVRRTNSENYCKAHDVPIYTNPTAFFVDPEDKVAIRTKDEVVDRALALWYIGLKSEGLEQKHLDKLGKDFNIMVKLTANERAYATVKHPTEQPKN
jgi:Domain of unknown function (DUF4272)